MIGIKFNGRLGNQIFQYVFYHYLKTTNPKAFHFFSNPHHSYLSKYFELDWFNNLTLSSKTYSVVARTLTRLLPFKEIYLENIRVPKQVQPEHLTIYKGFFQSDWYLNQLKTELKLSLKKKYKERFEKRFGQFFKTHRTIVVHVRRTDYLRYGKRDISLPLECFERILRSIHNVDDYKVLFVSDDIESVKLFFGKKDNYIFSSNDEITDFQIIMNADIAIISNSTFGWWAGYLSTKNTIVYAPKNWLGFRIGKEHPKKIMTNKFIWCDVFEEKHDFEHQK